MIENLPYTNEDHKEEVLAEYYDNLRDLEIEEQYLDSVDTRSYLDAYIDAYLEQLEYVDSELLFDLWEHFLIKYYGGTYLLDEYIPFPYSTPYWLDYNEIMFMFLWENLEHIVGELYG